MDISNFPYYIRDIIDGQEVPCMGCNKVLSNSDIESFSFSSKKHGKRDIFLLSLIYRCNDCNPKGLSTSKVPQTRVDIEIPSFEDFVKGSMEAINDGSPMESEMNVFYQEDDMSTDFLQEEQQLMDALDALSIPVGDSRFSDKASLLLSLEAQRDAFLNMVDRYHIESFENDRSKVLEADILESIAFLRDIISSIDGYIFEWEKMKLAFNRKASLTPEEKKILGSYKTHDDFLALIGVTPEMMREIKEEYY